jgi:ADP-ribosylglycohydrolase
LGESLSIIGRYVVESMEAALWALYYSQSFEEGCLMAVNLGNDADTTGAIYGQLAGAFYGKNQNPERWLSKLAHKNVIVDMADKLLALSIALSANNNR